MIYLEGWICPLFLHIFFWFSFKNVFLRPHFCVQFWNAVFLETSKNPSPLIFWKYLSWLYIVYIVFTCERWNHFLQSSLPAPLFDGFLPPNVLFWHEKIISFRLGKKLYMERKSSQPALFTSLLPQIPLLSSPTSLIFSFILLWSSYALWDLIVIVPIGMSTFLNSNHNKHGNFLFLKIKLYFCVPRLLLLSKTLLFSKQILSRKLYVFFF